MAISVYADGFGRWHAVVPNNSDALTRAVEAIMLELHARESGRLQPEDLRKYLHSSIVIVEETFDSLHFAEYAID